MDEKLRHLKESMDRTILRNGALRAEEKQNILFAIRMRKDRRKKRLRLGLGAAAVLCLSLAISLLWPALHDLSSHTKVARAPQEKSLSPKNKDQAEDKTEQMRILDASDPPQYNSGFKYEKNDTPVTLFTYIIFNHYYYRKTGQTADPSELGQEIGRIKRTGVWQELRSGDSNNMRPGPIYAIHGKDPAEYIAAKGTIMVGRKMRESYLIFKKYKPINP